MRKFSVLLGTLLACMCVGCGEDRNDELIASTIKTLKDTSNSIDQVAKILGDAASQAEATKKPLQLDAVAKAIAEADILKKKAGVLQQIKAQTEILKDNITPEQRADYSTKHKLAVQNAMQEVDLAQKRLDVALRAADKVADGPGQTQMAALRKKLDEAQTEFSVLTKRQS